MLPRIAGLLVFAGCAFCALEVQADGFYGFLTNVDSATEFDVGQRHVFCHAKTKWKRPAHLPDYLAGPRVGMPVYIDGELRKGAFVARSVKVDGWKEKAPDKIEGRGLIQQTPQLHPDGQGWAGNLGWRATR